MKFLLHKKCTDFCGLCALHPHFTAGKEVLWTRSAKCHWFWALDLMSSGPNTSEHHILEVTCHWFSLCLWALNVVADLKWSVEKHTFNVFLKWFVQHHSSVSNEAKIESASPGSLSLPSLLLLSLWLPKSFMPSSFFVKWIHKVADNSLSSFTSCVLCS